MQILNNNVDSCGYDDESFADLIQGSRPIPEGRAREECEGEQHPKWATTRVHGDRPGMRFCPVLAGGSKEASGGRVVRRHEYRWALPGRVKRLPTRSAAKTLATTRPKQTGNLGMPLESAGPRTCRNIEEGLGFEGCASCPHHGRIKSPIQLGRSAGSQPLTLLEHLHKLNEQYAVVLVGGRLSSSEGNCGPSHAVPRHRTSFHVRLPTPSMRTRRFLSPAAQGRAWCPSQRSGWSGRAAASTTVLFLTHLEKQHEMLQPFPWIACRAR